VNKVFLWRKS